MSGHALKHHQHEQFEINTSRKKIVRQDRVTIENGKCFLNINDQQIEILNLTAFGAGTLFTKTQYDVLKSKDIFEDVNMLYNGILIQTIKCKIVRSEQYTLSSTEDWMVGLEIIGEPINIDRIKALEAAVKTIDKTFEYKKLQDRIPHSFKTIVYEMKDWLTELRQNVITLEENAPVDNARQNSEYRETIADYISDYLGKTIPSVYLRLPSALGKVEDDIKSLCVEFIRKNIGPFVYGAPFAHRAYAKPRGYAGDFEMMNHLYRNEMVGKTLFDQCMHKYFIDEPAGEAVKNRGLYLFEKIKNLINSADGKRKLKIVSIASGPAKEVQLLLHNYSLLKKDVQVEFTFIDQDEESLKHAQKEILSINRFVKSNFEFKFLNLAIKNILAAGLPEQDYDLVYSAGLFDYFTDPVATLAAQKMLESCTPTGSAIIGNFSKSNPCVPFMEMVLDWHLIYRSPEDLERIFHPASKQVVVESESLGVNLFAVLRK